MMKTKAELTELLKLTDEVLAHWHRMDEWVSKQLQCLSPSPVSMRSTIGENWFSSSCAYCGKFTDPPLNEANCIGCPLETATGVACGEVPSVWMDVANSTTWAEWRVAAAKLIATVNWIKADLEKQIKESEEWVKSYVS
jgi:hypothetical protein